MKRAILMLGTLLFVAVNFTSCWNEPVETSGEDDNNGTGKPGTSLDGTWGHEGDALVLVQINGAVGILTKAEYNEKDDGWGWYEYVQAGFIKIGDQCFRNLVSTGDKTWKGEVLFRVASQNWITGEITLLRVEWRDCEITLSSDGTTFECVAETDTGIFYRE
ncbi:MAG: hypothetical protein LBV41_02455 [Cytophagaceae bacterium]|jgi:hypothetical protein|nr:hypothetical protein [Cytophagaceae bacterium]